LTNSTPNGPIHPQCDQAVKGINKGQRIAETKKSLKAQCFQESIMVREAGLEFSEACKML